MSVVCATFFLLLLLVGYIPLPVVSINSKLHGLFIFGDSLFDVGANNYINTSMEFRANFNPYGETFFKYPSGRFSNGRLIPDYIADYIRNPLMIPYMHPNYKFNGGANFASGGAGALVETHAGFVVDLETQLKQFEKLVKKELRGDKRSIISEAVYMFSIGTNDYAAKPDSQSHQQKYTAMVIGNLTNFLNIIYTKGGRKFVVMNVPPLGCFPQTRINASGCSKELNMVAKIHNEALPKALENMQTKFTGFNYSIFDIYHTLTKRIKHPSKYGFKQSKNACCDWGKRRDGKEYRMCKDPNKYVFFDSAHPTHTIYKQLANLMWSGGRHIIRPFNLKELFQF